MNWVVRIGYALMILAMILYFYFNKKGEKELRFQVDAFARIFCQLSNRVAPVKPKSSLLYEKKGGAVHPLPLEEQPEGIRNILHRAAANEPAALREEMSAYVIEMGVRCEKRRRLREQVVTPVRKLCYIADTFLAASIDLNTIDDLNKVAAFESFLQEQLDHRMVLFHRISREFSPEYLDLNEKYDLAAALQAERDAKEAERRKQQEATQREREQRRRKGGKLG